jgi:Protein of unknown function, DUF488
MTSTLKIVTASWSTVLPPDIVRVGISRGGARRQRGYRLLPALAPGAWFKSVGETEYIERYQLQLASLDPQAVYGTLCDMAHGAPCVALLCFERAGTDDGWCHRSLAAQWLSAGLGADVHEWGYETVPPNRHPLLPLTLMQNAVATDLAVRDSVR